MNIDYVMPYVDNTDPEWYKLYCQYSNENKHSKSENLKRFSTNILFKYVFRGIEKYMPWINNVFLIVQSETQIPKWINRQTVKIVLHEDFIPKEFLPTFNSCTIECFMHQISGLSPLYIYGNDDTYVMNHVKPSDFFDGAMPKNRLDMHYCFGNDYYEQMCIKMNSLIFQSLGYKQLKHRFLTPIHFQQAFSKSIVQNIFNKFQSNIYNSISKFREVKNLSQYFYIIYYMLSTNNVYFFKNVNYYRADIISEFKNIIDRFEHKKFPQLLCLNNNDNKRDIALMAPFNRLFPNPSKYELQ